jgi:asparagine synthase (glutamine-hydrolysing)
VEASRPDAPRVLEYWDLRADHDLGRPEAHFVEELRFLLEDAVRLQLRSDVPLGAHLSGGLDSTTVVCLARRRLGGRTLKTFTGAFEGGSRFDETDYARLVAKAAGADYHEIYPSPQDMAESLGRLVWFMDQPAAGAGLVPQYFVSRLAREHVKVVLGGQGGDELFLGYARYLAACLEEGLRGAIFETAEPGPSALTLEEIIPGLPALRDYQPLLQRFWRDGLFEDDRRRYPASSARTRGIPPTRPSRRSARSTPRGSCPRWSTAWPTSTSRRRCRPSSRSRTARAWPWDWSRGCPSSTTGSWS